MTAPPDAEDTSTNSLRAAVAGGLRPVVETLALMAGVTLCGWVAAVFGALEFVALAPGFPLRPWTLLSSIYAHGGPLHLLGNAVVVLVAGTPVAFGTTRARFHLFFLTTGAVAGVAQQVVGGLVGPAPTVLGASGAALALVGYVVAANPVTGLVGRYVDLSPRYLALGVGVGALVIALVLGSLSALVAHATGAALGLVAGMVGLLRVERTQDAETESLEW